MISAEAVEAAVHAYMQYPRTRGRDNTENMFRAALEAAAPHMLTRITNAVINRAYEDGRAAALREVADTAESVITHGDIAECAAAVPGERGRHNAVAARDSLYEDPAGWLRNFKFEPTK